MPRPVDTAALVRAPIEAETVEFTIAESFDLGRHGSGEALLKGTARLTNSQPVVKADARELSAESALIVTTVTDIKMTGNSESLGDVVVPSDPHLPSSVSVQDGGACSATLGVAIEFRKLGLKLRTRMPGHVQSARRGGADSDVTMNVLRPVELVDNEDHVHGTITGGRMLEHRFTR